MCGRRLQREKREKRCEMLVMNVNVCVRFRLILVSVCVYCPLVPQLVIFYHKGSD